MGAHAQRAPKCRKHIELRQNQREGWSPNSVSGILPQAKHLPLGFHPHWPPNGNHYSPLRLVIKGKTTHSAAKGERPNTGRRSTWKCPMVWQVHTAVGFRTSLLSDLPQLPGGKPALIHSSPFKQLWGTGYLPGPWERVILPRP